MWSDRTCLHCSISCGLLCQLMSVPIWLLTEGTREYLYKDVWKSGYALRSFVSRGQSSGLWLYKFWVILENLLFSVAGSFFLNIGLAHLRCYCTTEFSRVSYGLTYLRRVWLFGNHLCCLVPEKFIIIPKWFMWKWVSHCFGSYLEEIYDYNSMKKLAEPLVYYGRA